MRERNLSLDLLRGICALGIAVYHYMAWAKGYKLQSLGTFGVYTFFVISALVMMMSYAGDFRNEITVSALKDFFRNRAARILPLLALISILAAVRYRGDEGMTLTKVVLTASGLFALHMPGFLSMTTGAWSLGIELLFYALFPVICILAANARITSLLIALAIAVVA
jgi:peptidoglycan/LPS O-acetylase OafA/YrhL